MLSDTLTILIIWGNEYILCTLLLLHGWNSADAAQNTKQSINQ